MVNLEIIVKDNYAKALTNFAVFVNLIAYCTLLNIVDLQETTLDFVIYSTLTM